MLKPKEQALPLDLNKKLNIAHINICTEAEGPYKRMAIWFQGCNIRCAGCCNPELQELKVANIMTVGEVVKLAIQSQLDNQIEGVTFLGGEPTLQDGLLFLVKRLSALNIGTILFTGKDYDELDDELKKSVDLVIDGSFVAEQIDNERNLIGSRNQHLVFCSERYKEDMDWFSLPREKRVEINLGKKVFINGDVI